MIFDLNVFSKRDTSHLKTKRHRLLQISVFFKKKISIFSNKTGEKFNLTLGLIQL